MRLYAEVTMVLDEESDAGMLQSPAAIFKSVECTFDTGVPAAVELWTHAAINSNKYER